MPRLNKAARKTAALGAPAKAEARTIARVHGERANFIHLLKEARFAFEGSDFLQALNVCGEAQAGACLPTINPGSAALLSSGSNLATGIPRAAPSGGGHLW